jgi:acyl-CoA thioesterase
MKRFDAFTHVRDDGVATIDPGVSGFLGAFGGYVVTLALRAMQQAVDGERLPRSLTLHLPTAAQPGPLSIATTVERAGGAMSTATARLTQHGTPVGLALGAFGEPRASLAQQDATMPDVPPPEDLAPLAERPVGGAFPVEHRPAIGMPLSGGDRAELGAWMRLATETRGTDALAATFLADALAPALYGQLTEYVPLPSAEIAIHYGDTAPSDSPWVLAVARNRLARDGYAIEDLELWTPDARLLLVSRQLRRVLAQAA